MTTRSKRTKGEWTVHNTGENVYQIKADIQSKDCPKNISDYYNSIGTVSQRDPNPAFGGGIPDEVAKANAKFIAMCGTIAHQLDSMGWDGEKVIEALPHIMEVLKFTQDYLSDEIGARDGAMQFAAKEASELLNALKP